MQAIPLKKLPLVVAGDYVTCEKSEGSGTSSVRITQIHPRKSMLARPDRRGHLKPLAANVTRLFIVVAPKPVPETLLIDQFCIVAKRAGIEPVVVLNKLDRIADGKDPETGVTADYLASLLGDYSAAGFKTLRVCAKGQGDMQPMHAAIREQTSVLVGQSGVGKSSIVKEILPDQDIRIGAVSSATGIGAHTTTTSFWYELNAGGALIDSPGVRQFLVDYLKPAEVESGYPEIIMHANECRFSNCSHHAEPNCAVRVALAKGEISAVRFENYLKLSKLS